MNKYRAIKKKVDGIKFDSRLEAKRYSELKLLERAGEIANLEIKPVFKFSIDGRPVLIRSDRYKNGRQAKYTADFAYFDTRKNCRVVEDTKGHATAEYKLRKAITEAMYPGVKIQEVTK